MQDPSPRLPQPGISVLTWLVTGIAIGAAIATSFVLLMGYLELETLGAAFDLVASSLVGVIAGFLLAAVVGLPIAVWLVRRLLRSVHGSLVEVAEQSHVALQGLAAGDLKGAVDGVGGVLRTVAAWHSVNSARHFAIQTSFNILILAGGVVGTLLVGRQVILLKAQNEKLDLQAITAEAQRRTGLWAQLFSIIDDVTKSDEPIILQREWFPQNDGGPPLQARQTNRWDRANLSIGLTARIVTFTRAATPYWVVEYQDRSISGQLAARISNKPTSPERGLLLANLARMRVPLDELNSEGATFESVRDHYLF